MKEQNIKAAVKNYMLNDFLPGEDPAALTDTTPLMTTGILDSLAVLKVVTFLEDQFGISINPARSRSKEPQHNMRHCPSGDIQESIDGD